MRDRMRAPPDFDLEYAAAIVQGASNVGGVLVPRRRGTELRRPWTRIPARSPPPSRTRAHGPIGHRSCAINPAAWC
jgi:hypothetical protein